MTSTLATNLGVFDLIADCVDGGVQGLAGPLASLFLLHMSLGLMADPIATARLRQPVIVEQSCAARAPRETLPSFCAIRHYLLVVRPERIAAHLRMDRYRLRSIPPGS